MTAARTAPSGRALPARLLSLLGLAALLVAAGAAAASAVTLGPTTRVSVSTSGAESLGAPAELPQTSADGRYVVFQTAASELVPNDSNGAMDVFLRDTQGNTTVRVSVTGSGAQTSGPSRNPVISADGRYVAFMSYSSDLVAGDTNVQPDIFRWDRTTGQTIRVSVAAGNVEGNGQSFNPTISADGSYVAYESYASNLVGDDTNGEVDVFRAEIVGSVVTTVRVSVASNGDQAAGLSTAPSISGNGSRIAFLSTATALASDDTNGLRDVFVRNLAASTTTRVNVASDGTQATSYPSSDARISGDGRYVVYATLAPNLLGQWVDNNNATDVFRYTVATGLTERVSVENSGAAQQDHSTIPAISTDGRLVAYGFQGGVRVRDVAARTTTSIDPGNGNVPSLAIAGEGRSVVFSSTAPDLVGGDLNGFADIFRTPITAPLVITLPTTATAGVSVDAQIVDGGADLTASYTFSTDDAQATVSGASITFGTAGTRTVTATPTGAGSPLTTTITVTPGAPTTLNTPTINTTTTTAGSTVTVLQVTGSDAYGNPTGSVLGQTKILSTTDPQAVIDGRNVELRTSGPRQITVSLIADESVTVRANVIVNAGPVVSLSPYLSRLTTDAGSTVTLSAVTARDAYGNNAGSALTQSEILSTSDPQAVVNGRDIEYRTAGVRTVTVALTADTTITGTAAITVGPGAPVSLVPTFSRTSVSAGDTVTLSAVAGRDAFGNTIASITAPVEIRSTTDPQAVISGTSVEYRTAGVHQVLLALVSDPLVASLNDIDVQAGSPATLSPSLSSSATAAGSSISVTVVPAVDAYGNPLGDISGQTEILSTSDPQAQVSGLDVEFRTAGTQELVVALIGSPNVSSTLEVAVVAGPLAALVPTTSTPSSTAGESVAVTRVSGTDAYGNPLGDVTSLSEVLSTTDALADVGTLFVVLRTAGPQTITVGLNGNSAVTGAATVGVTAAAADVIAVTLSSSGATAGDSVSVSSVTGTDAYGNPTGDITTQTRILSTSDPQAVISGRDVELRTAGARTVTVGLTANAAVSADALVTVTAGAAASLTPVPSTTSPIAGVPIAVTSVAASDAFGNSVGDVTSQSELLTSSDDDAVLAGLDIEFRTAGSQTLTVGLAADPNVSGSVAVTVAAGTIDDLDLTLSAATVPQGGSLSFTVGGLDAYGNPTGDLTAAATVTSDVATDVVGVGTVTFPTASPHTLTATYQGFRASVVVQVVPTPAGGGTDALGATGADVTGALALAGILSGSGALLLLVLVARRARRAGAGQSTSSTGSSVE